VIAKIFCVFENSTPDFKTSFLILIHSLTAGTISRENPTPSDISAYFIVQQ